MTAPTWCCAQMAEQLTSVCPDHPEPQDCPDVLVRHRAATGVYVLWIHDGGSSFITIAYCPWCGVPLGPPPAAGEGGTA